MLFWHGIVMEFQAVWSGQPAVSQGAMPTIRNADPSRFDLIGNARTWGPVEAAYRRVLQLDPGHAEARLHLGYALCSQRRYADANAELETARDQSRDPFVVYMGGLLLARLKEERHDLDGAAREYERALAITPGAQSAYVGLSLVEARRGNARRARELVSQFASIPERDRVRDPWWLYRGSRVAIEDLHWLRQAVRP
jgi:tetratricopeptide (TPR) repeat protein